MTALTLLLALVAAQSRVGEVQMLGPAQSATLALRLESPAQDLPLIGAPTDELRRLGGARVEVLGEVDGDNRFVVASYRILRVGGSDKPWLGLLVALSGDQLGLQDGDGSPIVLSMNAPSRKKLTAQLGAKVWVQGKKLVSGELRVQSFGILRPPTADRDTSGEPTEPNHVPSPAPQPKT